MWLITGPFDGEVVGDVSFQKTKLLKPGTPYTLGRKDVRLLINNKKISGEHGVFKVAKFSTGDVAKLSSIPALTFESGKKPFKIRRNEASINVTLSEVAEIQPGDEITLINGLNLKFQWMGICCYSSTAPKNVWNAGCASLGIHIVPISCPEVTHHLTSDYSTTTNIATSLISSVQLVKPEWLEEVLRLGSLSGDYDAGLGLPMEDNFSLPAVTKFRPNMPQNLEPAYARPGVWEPNEERLHLFKDYRFLCVGEKAREVPLDLRNMIERGDGTLESFDVHLGVDKFRRAITRGRAKAHKKLVLVGDERLLSSAVGEDVVREFVQEAQSCNLSFISPDTLVQTVLDVDTTKLDASPGTESNDNDKSTASSLPDRIPNTYSEEASVVNEPSEKAPPRRLTRRAASREPSAAPEISPMDPPPIPRLRRPIRRLNQNADMVTGLDDPSSILDALPDLDAPVALPPMSIDLTAPTPGRPMRLKRRARQASTEPSHPFDSMAGTYEVQDSIREPPLKRFKALFEASDPDKLEQSQAILESQVDVFAESERTGSQTQTESQARTASGSRGKSVASLAVLREEEEESLETNGSSRKKRRLHEGGDGVVEESAESENPPAKRRATESSHVAATSQTSESVQGPPPSKARAKPPSRATAPPSKAKPKGAEPGKPDTDAEFLKAIASTKKGKRGEDDFDREFNKLKISKPDLQEEEPEKEWNVLAEFGDDSGVRGNFMTILEMEVFKERNGVARARQDNPDWHGKPNFKKFKKKIGRAERPRIDLFVSVENDCGIGPAYWKNGASQNQTQPKEPQPKPKKRAASTVPSFDASSQEVVELVSTTQRGKPRARSRTASSKAPSRAGSAAPAPAQKPTRRAKPMVIEEEDEQAEEGDKLFLGVESDAESMVLDEDQDEEETFDTFDTKKSKAAPKPPSRAKAAAGKKVKKPIVKADSGDEAVFKGFGRRRG